MRPLMYGYLRVDLVGDQVADWEERIRRFAEAEGFDLGMVFHERGGGRAAFSALITELRRAEARHVVVPSMLHVWGPGEARHALVARLWNEAGAGVWVADQQANRITGRGREQRHGPTSGDDERVESHEIRLTLGPHTPSAAAVRVRCVLSRWQLGELQAPAERIVSELLHEALAAADHDAVEPVVIRLRRGRSLVIEVVDGTPGRRSAEVGARVRGLSAHCECRPVGSGGRITRCELPIRTAA